jgi:hypothetical protein
LQHQQHSQKHYDCVDWQELRPDVLEDGAVLDSDIDIFVLLLLGAAQHKLQLFAVLVPPFAIPTFLAPAAAAVLLMDDKAEIVKVAVASAGVAMLIVDTRA